MLGLPMVYSCTIIYAQTALGFHCQAPHMSARYLHDLKVTCKPHDSFRWENLPHGSRGTLLRVKVVDWNGLKQLWY